MPRIYESFGIENVEKFIAENLPHYIEDSKDVYMGYRYILQHYKSNNFEVDVVLDASADKESILLKTLNLNVSNMTVWTLEPQLILNKDYCDGVSGLFGVEGKEGSLPAVIINADALPRIEVGEKIKAQIAAFAIHIDLYDTKEEVKNLFPEWEGHEAIPDSKGKKLCIAEGVIFPLQFMLNHQVKMNNEKKNIPYDLSDDEGFINAKILSSKKLDCGEHKGINCIGLTVETEFGELEIYTADDGRDYSAGRYIVASIVVSADVRIYEHGGGARYTEPHLLKLLQDAFERGEFDRIIYALSDNCKYTSEGCDKIFDNANDILKHLDSVVEARKKDNEMNDYEYEFVDGEHPILKEYLKGELYSTFSIKVEDKKIVEINVTNEEGK